MINTIKTTGSPSQSRSTPRPRPPHSTRPTQNQHHQFPTTTTTTTTPRTDASRPTQHPQELRQPGSTITMALATATPCRRPRWAVRDPPRNRTARPPSPDPRQRLPLPRRAGTPRCCPSSGLSTRTVRFSCLSFEFFFFLLVFIFFY